MAVRFSDFIAARSAGTIDGSDVVAIKAGATVKVDGDTVVKTSDVGTMAAETATNYYTKTAADAAFAPLTQQRILDAVAARGNVVLADDFGTGANLSGATTLTGQSWSGTSGATVSGGRVARANGLGTAYVDWGVSNGTLAGTFQSSIAWSGTEFAIVFRAAAASFDNCLHVRFGQSNLLNILKRSGGTNTSLATTSVTLNNGQAYRCSIDFNGAVIRGTMSTLGGHVVGSVTHTLTGGDETSFATGNFAGFRGFLSADSWWFDDFAGWGNT
jgi:hypothetical protein